MIKGMHMKWTYLLLLHLLGGSSRLSLGDRSSDLTAITLSETSKEDSDKFILTSP